MKHRMASKTMLVVIAVVAVLMSSVGVGAAEAKYREAPRLQMGPSEMWTLGSNGCQGTLGVSVKDNRAKRGWVQINLRNKGFTRSCHVTVLVNYQNGIAPFNHGKRFTVKVNRGRGGIVASKKYYIASGVHLLGITSAHPASKGVAYWVNTP